MPYIPRSIAPSLPDLNLDKVPRAPSRATSDKPAVPYVKNEAVTEHNPNKLIGRLNMLKFDVPPTKIYKHITNKELNIDEYSRLVSSSRPPS
jgi:hypothetical protein